MKSKFIDQISTWKVKGDYIVFYDEEGNKMWSKPIDSVVKAYLFVEDEKILDDYINRQGKK